MQPGMEMQGGMASMGAAWRHWVFETKKCWSAINSRKAHDPGETEVPLCHVRNFMAEVGMDPNAQMSLSGVAPPTAMAPMAPMAPMTSLALEPAAVSAAPAAPAADAAPAVQVPAEPQLAAEVPAVQEAPQEAAEVPAVAAATPQWGDVSTAWARVSNVLWQIERLVF